MGTVKAQILPETDSHRTAHSSRPDGKTGCRSDVYALNGLAFLRQRHARSRIAGERT
jgi:hypothetical protein